MTEEKIDRTPRASETRATKTARKPWRPPSLLDAPLAPEGFTHRWIRSEVRGFDDRKNISARMREGWELVRKEEYPDFEAPTIEGGRHEGVFGVGAAAPHYFGVAAADLSATQAARLAAILPDPKERSASRPGDFTRKRTAQIMDGAATIRADGRAACFES